MPFEKSVSAVIFKKNKEIKYLLLHYPSSAKATEDYWDFSKGHIEKGENELETLKREVEEETGIKDLKIINGFKGWIKYFFKYQGENIFKIVTFYLAKTNTKEIKLSPEHIDYKWLPYQEVVKQLKFKNTKEIFKKANNFIFKKNPPLL